MITIEITKRTEEICLKALKAALSIYKGDIGPTIEILKDGFVKPAYFNDQEIVNFNSYLKTLDLRDGTELENLLEKIGNSLNGEKDLTFDEMFLICSNLEIVERLWIGQWEHLSYIIQDFRFIDREHLRVVNSLRDEITDAYSRKGFGDYASYGIYSPELKDEVRLLYAFQKVYRYEISATGTDTAPFSLSGKLNEDVPKIFLPYKNVITFNTIEEIKNYYDEWMKKQEKLSFFDKKNIYCGPNNVYFFPTDNTTSYAVEPGDTVFLKQNDYFIVKKTEENLAKWNNK